MRLIFFSRSGEGGKTCSLAARETFRALTPISTLAIGMVCASAYSRLQLNKEAINSTAAEAEKEKREG